jgi:hypothetical protein
MSLAPSTGQGVAGAASGLLGGFAAGMKNETQLAHELRLEQMAALRMARYGGMYGGGGTQNMVKLGDAYAAGLIDDPKAEGSQLMVPFNAIGNYGSTQEKGRVGAEMAGAGITKSALTSKQEYNAALADKNARAAAENVSSDPNDPAYQAAYATSMNQQQRAGGAQVIDYGHNEPTQGWWAQHVQRGIFGSNPQTFMPNAAPAQAAPNTNTPILPPAIGNRTMAPAAVPGANPPPVAPPPGQQQPDPSTGYMGSDGQFHSY